MSDASILIVDDALFMRTMLKGIFSEAGYKTIHEAEDGVEAVERYAALRPDLVTMDIVMPRMDGIEALKKILAANPDAKVVMCSALGQEALIIEALESGAKDFIVKPFKPPKVVSVVERILRG
jgi:two-component system chemotaxis response regulator CheY